MARCKIRWIRRARKWTASQHSMVGSFWSVYSGISTTQWIGAPSSWKSDLLDVLEALKCIVAKHNFYSYFRSWFCFEEVITNYAVLWHGSSNRRKAKFCIVFYNCWERSWIIFGSSVCSQSWMVRIDAHRKNQFAWEIMSHYEVNTKVSRKEVLLSIYRSGFINAFAVCMESYASVRGIIHIGFWRSPVLETAFCKDM